jgi:hypothetical protein
VGAARCRSDCASVTYDDTGPTVTDVDWSTIGFSCTVGQHISAVWSGDEWENYYGATIRIIDYTTGTITVNWDDGDPSNRIVGFDEAEADSGAMCVDASTMAGAPGDPTGLAGGNYDELYTEYADTSASGTMTAWACQVECAAKGYCCNDYTVGSNQLVSCAQACRGLGRLVALYHRSSTLYQIH